MKEDRFYLLHIRDACKRVIEFTHDSEQIFLSDLKTQDAVIRNLQIIGEAAKKVSQTTKHNTAISLGKILLVGVIDWFTIILMWTWISSGKQR